MTSHLTQSPTQLKALISTAPASEGVEISEILKAISKKTPENILKKTDLFEFSKNYDDIRKKTAPELTQFLKTDITNLAVIDILIAIYILNGSKGNLGWSPAPITEPEPETPPEKRQHMEERYHPSDVSFLLDLNEQKPTRQAAKLISKYIDGRYVLPPGSPIEGIYNINLGPYVIELHDNMSPYSTCRHMALKKGVQIFATTIALNIIAYYIGERPSKIMYMTATDTLVKKFSNTKLDPIIDGCDLRHLIFAQAMGAKSNKSGDITKYKEFIGGTLALVSLQSAADMRSESIKILIRDEVAGAPRMLSTGEGDFASVSEGRVQAFIENGGKIFDLSTPGLHGECLIDEQFLIGDQRKFFVDCPLCKKSQWLEMGTEKSKHGLKGDYKAGVLDQGYYLCYHCHDAIFDHHKAKLLKSGIWRPFTTAKEKYFRSYHLPSFYSPPGIATFTYIRQKYDKAMDKGDDGMRSFKNLYEAEAFQPSGESPKLDHVYELRSTYRSGTVPSGVMWLTMYGDVQRGGDKWKDHTNEEISELSKKLIRIKDYVKLGTLPRIEIEVMGHGRKFRTSSIIYKAFYGHVTDYTSGAWELLLEWGQKNELKFKRKDGFKFGVLMTFIDSGHEHQTVYDYCDPLPMTYASKGADKKRDKNTSSDIDSRTGSDWQHWKLSKSGSHPIVLIKTNYYKHQLYNKLKNGIGSDESDQPPNTHRTPSDYPDNYFKMLTAEKQRIDGSFHNPAGRRNESTDTNVGNLCASDFLVEGEIMQDRRIYKKRNVNLTDEQIRKVINRESLMDKWEKSLRKQGW